MKKQERRRATVIEVLYREEIEHMESVDGNRTHVRFKGEDKQYTIPTSVLDKLAEERGW